MEITVSIPDDLIPVAAVNEDVSRQMLEAYAIENYRQGRMSLGGVAELLDLSIDEANAFLETHNVPQIDTKEDFDADRHAAELFLKKR
jgi:predicted HTH domain antitoxin